MPSPSRFPALNTPILSALPCPALPSTPADLLKQGSELRASYSAEVSAKALQEHKGCMRCTRNGLHK